MFYPQTEAKIEWTPVEEIERRLEERLRPQREEARIKAEQEAIEAERKVELFVAKGTLAYSELLAIEICERISSGELLIAICLDEHMPTVRRVTQWQRENGDFDALYKESLNDRLTIFEEQIIQIADDASRDFKEVTRNGRAQRVPMARLLPGPSCALKCASGTLGLADPPSGVTARLSSPSPRAKTTRLCPRRNWRIESPTSSASLAW
jgi:hypothetical protein